jgi:SAM-dependent methyltransferase
MELELARSGAPWNGISLSPIDQRKPMHNSTRRPHAILERDSRVNKATKIISIVGEARFQACRRILEIGCGSGVIASTLSEVSASAEVFAVDVADNRIDSSGFEFHKVEGTELPFPAGHFDLVISNHVIEHVGTEGDQLDHLNEIKRVLSPSGLAYLAVPNKWRIMEPHYKLPLLSWLPQRMADILVRGMGRGTFYDCRPLSAAMAKKLFVGSGLAFHDATMKALRTTFEIEKRGALSTKLIGRIPDWVLRPSFAIVPTFVYLLGKTGR